jgi:hypothetical protein
VFPRNARAFGTVDLADAIAAELPLNQLAGTFSFDEAAEAAQRNPRLMHGRRVENMFEYVVASPGHAKLISDQGWQLTQYSNKTSCRSPQSVLTMRQ